MNTYFITFPFRGIFHFIKVNANMLANRFLEAYGSSYDFTFDEGQFYNKTFSSINPETKQEEILQVEFDKNDTVTVFHYNDNPNEKLAGSIIEKDIPWLLLKVENDEGEIIFDINDK
jgi:outer membrane protein assembly factor BamE (lipoprotein component of BamABCDE complex)